MRLVLAVALAFPLSAQEERGAAALRETTADHSWWTKSMCTREQRRGYAEHLMRIKQIPLENYQRDVVAQFNPVKVVELARVYQPDLMWFDTPHKLPASEQLRILKALREAALDVVVNLPCARFGNRQFGDYQNTGGGAAKFRATEGDWESLPTTNDSYGYHQHGTFPPGAAAFASTSDGRLWREHLRHGADAPGGAGWVQINSEGKYFVVFACVRSAEGWAAGGG